MATELPTPPSPLATKTAMRFGKPTEEGWRQRLYCIIFEADTSEGRRFDLALISAILLSIFVVLVDSVQSINRSYGQTLGIVEWGFTLLFTIEYILRLICVKHPLRYATSFFGVIDLLSVLPTYLALFMPELHALLDVRILRLLRVFRILKLSLYVEEYQLLTSALAASRRKIFVFLSMVLMVVLIMGTLLYVLEGPEHGFTSIPKAMYWAIVTMTTVGYGDMVPQTEVGKAIASVMMLIGWGTLAVPTGIVTSEIAAQRLHGLAPVTNRTCPKCPTEGLDSDANFCKHCGAALPRHQQD